MKHRFGRLQDITGFLLALAVLADGVAITRAFFPSPATPLPVVVAALVVGFICCVAVAASFLIISQ